MRASIARPEHGRRRVGFAPFRARNTTPLQRIRATPLAACLLAFAASPAVGQEIVELSGDAEDATGDGRAFVELATPRKAVFVGEPVVLTLRFGFEADFQHENLLQLFARPLDVPAQLLAPWLDGLEGLAPLDAPLDARGGHGSSFALNETVVRAARGERRVEGERAFEVLEIERRFTTLAPGTRAFPAPVLRFAHASEFADDFVHGRVALDRRDALVRGQPLVVEVLPLPEEGRPASFSGAIGRFQVQASAEPRDLADGASLKLTLAVTGEGNLAEFRVPSIEPLLGFRVLGSIDTMADGRRTITYDVLPRDASVKAVPAIGFPFFEPGPPAAYRVVETEPIPILVRPARQDPAEPPPTPSPSASPEEPGSHGSGALVVIAAVIATVLAARVRRLRARAATAARGHDAALERLRTSVAAVRDGARRDDLAHALAEVLAAFLDADASTVFGRGLRGRLETAGAPADLAARASAELETLLSARYGHGASAGPGDEAIALRTAALAEELLRCREHDTRARG